MTTTEKIVQCYECERERPIDVMDSYELFDTPWDNEGSLHYFCSDEFGHAVEENDPKSSWNYYDSCSEVLFDTSWADFRYFNCADCYRTICEQNPRNGWHVQYRIEDECEQICLQCFQTQILAYGVSRDVIENGEISGLFFNYNDPLLEGWDKFIDYRFIASHGDKDSLLAEVLKNMDNGYKVVIGYENMSIGGLEGSVSVYRKPE